MLDSHSVVERQACFQFKTSFSPCTIMQITHYDLDQLEAHLVATISRAPNFFIGSALVIDLESIKAIDVDFARMKHIIIANNMVPVGVRGGDDKQHFDAVNAGLPVIAVGRQSTAAKPTAVEKDPAPREEIVKEDVSPAKTGKPYNPSKIITTPIRSGMQVYARDADLIVIAPVSVGAELLADGNIHVYGPLRGRALAGVQGDTSARIFCRSLEAELVAIAGYYLVKDDMHTMMSQDATVQIYLANEQVKIEIV